MDTITALMVLASLAEVCRGSKVAGKKCSSVATTDAVDINIVKFSVERSADRFRDWMTHSHRVRGGPDPADRAQEKLAFCAVRTWMEDAHFAA
jgi:hypothetical protein